MTIGSFGDIVFKASAKKTQTFKDLQWKSSANYSTHERHTKKALLELTGYEPDEITFGMELSAFLGANPEKVMKKLHKMMKKGTVSQLVIGTSCVGGKWVITDIGRSYGHIYKDGTLLSCTVDVTLKEYN